MVINLAQIISKLDDKDHPTVDDYKFSPDWMTKTFQLWKIIAYFCDYIRKMSYFHPKLESEYAESSLSG